MLLDASAVSDSMNSYPDLLFEIWCLVLPVLEMSGIATC